MKSLILKDCYNIGHNAKTMVVLLLFLGVVSMPASGVVGFIVLSAVLCSMMLVTTFTFDETSKWTRYAMIMPVTKNELVLSKYLVLLLFTTIGVALGGCVGLISGLILKNVDFMTTVTAVLVALATAVVMGGISVPLLFHYGAEKARMLIIVSFSIPALLYVAVIKIAAFFHITISQNSIMLLLYVSPVLLIIMLYLSYRISCRIFAKKEF